MILRDKILTLRKTSGLSQEQLAAQLGVSRQSVSKWETGTAVPELDKLRMLSDFFHVSADYLIRDEWDEDLMADRSAAPEEDSADSYTATPSKSRKSRLLHVTLAFLAAFTLFLLTYLSVSSTLKIGAAELMILFIFACRYLIPAAFIITLIVLVMRSRKK